MRRLAIAIALLAAGCPLAPLDLPGGPPGGGAGGDGGGACASDEGCDDGNPCTRDRCVMSSGAGRCEAEPSVQGTSCDDGDLCNGLALCDGQGSCQPGAPRAIDDADPCTADACDPATGDVTHTPLASCAAWQPTALSGAPIPRSRHTAIWTGSRMIVWGGLVSGAPSVTATGGVYDPATNSWTPTSMTGAPAPRHSHVAVWTGSQMLIWGGYGVSDYESTGALYDPATDTWTPIDATSAPLGRTDFAAAWTGAELFVWGGLRGTAAIATGGRYDPAADAWTATPGTAAGAPSQRFGCSAVWTGDQVIVWGGNDTFDWHEDGTAFDPATNAWLSPLTLAGAPERRERHTALWVGSQMIVWGGWNGGLYLDTGALFDPAAGGQWTTLTVAGAPAGRGSHAAVWTGDRMIVWGGCGGDACAELYADGGTWTPDGAGGVWAPIPAHPSLAARKAHTAVWTGRALLVWGGQTAAGPTDTGGLRMP